MDFFIHRNRCRLSSEGPQLLYAYNNTLSATCQRYLTVCLTNNSCQRTLLLFSYSTFEGVELIVKLSSMLLQKLACKGVARFSAYEILDLHTGLTVLPVGSNGAHIKGVASSLQLPTPSTPTPLLCKSWF